MKITVTLNGVKPNSKIYLSVQILGNFDKTTGLIAECKTRSDLEKLQKENLIKLL